MFRQLIAAVLATLTLQALAAVDINKASQAELEQVPGIGPGLSAKIVQARQASAFRDWNDVVERVRGVGPGSAAKLSKGGLTVAGQAYTPVAMAEGAKPAKARKAAEPAPR
jgi:competence protein ComEA